MSLVSTTIKNVVSTNNSTTTPLNSGNSFTGTWEEAYIYNSLEVALITDQASTLQVQFSPDATNIDTTLTYSVEANLNEVHRLTITRRYFRIIITNTSASNQTFLRCQVMLGSFQTLTSALNSSVQNDADSLLTRGISEELTIASGLLIGYSIVNKFGLNPDIDMAGNEDIWGGDGFYTGFPNSSVTPEILRIVSTSTADTLAGTGARIIRVTGLDANYNIQSENINLNGTGVANSVNTYRRVHTAQIISVGSGGVNAGAITVSYNTTTTTVFLIMSIGRNQTNCSAYTVPAGYTAYMRKIQSACGTSSNVALDGNIWTRSFDGVFRSRRPFYISDTSSLNDTIYGGLAFTEKSDIIIRINTCSGTNVPVNAGYDLVLSKNL